MKRRKRHTLLKFIILAVIAGGVVQYSGVLKDTGVFPEKITNQISVEQKNAKAETYSGTAEEQTVKSTEISTENETDVYKRQPCIQSDYSGIVRIYE